MPERDLMALKVAVKKAIEERAREGYANLRLA
jgi:hypothetical protein